MKTAVGYQTYYTLICKRESIKSGTFTALHLHRGCYSDIRDMMQTMISLSRKYSNESLVFLVECSQRRPMGWLHPSRYND